jgi:tetratricopeptide (TPR) repeat protein
LIIAAAYLLFMRSFSGVWLMDDMPVLVNNPDIRSFSNFLENLYPGRPLRELTYLLDYQLFGLEPAGYYLQNIFWHGLNAALVFAVARTLRCPTPVAWFSALLFLVHPIQVEVVSNTSHRKDSLELAFSLVALCCYARGRETKQGRPTSLREGRWWLLAAVTAWGIALSAKQNALALPIVLLCWEIFRLQGRRRLVLAWSMVSLAFAGTVLRIASLASDPLFTDEVQGALRKLGYFAGNSSELYFQTVFKAWAFMLSKLLAPFDLSMEYTFSVPGDWGDPWVVAGLAAAVTALIALGVAFIRKSQILFVGLSWFICFWLPTSNLFGHLAYFAADRYWYSPSVGLVLVVAYAAWRLLGGRLVLFSALAVFVVTPLVWLSWQQQGVWCDEEAFYEQMNRVNPDALEGLIGLGNKALKDGRLSEASAYFERAFPRNPQDGRILHNLGLIAYRRGEYDRALDAFRQALRVSPELVEVYNNMGSLYDDIGQPQRAVEVLREGLTINPHFEKIYTNLGVVYERMGRLDRAEAMHRRALAENPGYGPAYYNLGNTLYHAGRKDEAMASFARATSYLADDLDAWYNFAAVAGELGRRGEFAVALQRLRSLDAELAAELEAEVGGGVPASR